MLNSSSLRSEEILKRVRKHVAEKTRDETYSTDPFLEAEKHDSKINHQEQAHTFLDSLDRAYEKLCQDADPWEFIEITSHRGKVGTYIVLLKKLLRKAIHPITKLILGKQREFDLQLSMFLGRLVNTFREHVTQEEDKKQARHEKLLMEILDGYKKTQEVQNEILKRQNNAIDFQNKVAKNEERLNSIQRAFDSLELAYCSLTKDMAKSLTRSNGKTGKDREEAEKIISRARSHFSYKKFNEKFSGEVEFEKKLYKQYLKYFRGCQKVLDLGCGRAPFLELLKENSIGALGVDSDIKMVESARRSGFNIEQGDALEYIEKQGSETFDGIFMGHLVEHFPLHDLVSVLRHSYISLKKGCYLVFETPNIASLFVLSNAYFKDGTHSLPRHAEFYKFLAEDVGFRDVSIKYSYRVSEEEGLKLMPEDSVDKTLQPERKVYNHNIRFLRDTLFGETNTAIIAKK